MPEDILGQLTQLCSSPPLSHNSPPSLLVRRFIFYGLKSINFANVSYFALVFASLMCTFEFYDQAHNLNSLFEFFLYKFMNFFVLESLKLNFNLLFENVQESQQ